MIRFASAAMLAIALTACSGDKPAAKQDQRSAEGEVLGGSISDAMIPLETLTSQSPPKKQVAKSGTDADAAEDAGDEAAEGEGDEAQPAAEPAAEAPAAPAEAAEQ